MLGTFSYGGHPTVTDIELKNKISVLQNFVWLYYRCTESDRHVLACSHKPSSGLSHNYVTSLSVALKVSQLRKKLPTFYRSRRFITVFLGLQPQEETVMSIVLNLRFLVIY